MWPDNETTTDFLGFEVHARLIEAILDDDGMLPVTVGVFGDWGGGKTSVLRMLQDAIDPEQSGGRDGKTVCIYFNGWLFEGYDDAKSAVMSTILAELAAHKTFGPKARVGIKELLKSVNWMRLTSFALNRVAVPAATAFSVGGSGLVGPAIGASVLSGLADEAVTAAAEPTADSMDAGGDVGEPEVMTDIRAFRQRFEELISESGMDRVVVLVDDLDRCSPKNILGNLEAIRLFLNVEKTAFVVAADPRIIRFAIGREYPNIDAESIAESRVMDDYLEKLIQVPYHLPRLSPSETESYMALLFASQALRGDERLESLLGAYRTHLERNRYQAFGYGQIKSAIGDLEEPLNAELALVAKAAPLVGEGLKGNPRQVKRFLNALLLRKQLATVAGLSAVRDDVSIKLMILEYVRPKLFKQLYEWQAAHDGRPTALSVLEKRLEPATGKSRGKGTKQEPDSQGDLSGWVGPFPTKWLAMPPSLVDVDLRDYFWIARDRLASTMSEVSLMSPVVRRLVDAFVGDGEADRDMAPSGLAELDEGEAAQLLDALSDYVLRNPESGWGHMALMEAAKAQIPGAQESLAAALQTAQQDKIPPSVGVALLNTQEELGVVLPVLEEAISELRASGTRAGKVLVVEGEG